MATHVVCPICGKSSSIKTFPAGAGTDLVLQTFRSLGRGKGFQVATRESGIDDKKIAQALKPKLLGFVSVFVDHGHVTTDEIIESVVDEAGWLALDRDLASDAKQREPDVELAVEKRTRAFLEREVTELQLGQSRLLKQWREAERDDTILRHRLDDLNTRTDRLVAATRDGVDSLQRLRGEMKNATRGTKELAEHLRKMRAIVEAVQALREAHRAPPGERGDEVTSRDRSGRRG